MKRDILVVTAPRTKFISKTGFKGYDLTINPYVGCQFGCRYCYVRFFITDNAAAARAERPPKEWGDFVRVREHVDEKLPGELSLGLFRIPTGKRPRTVPADEMTKKEKERVLKREGGTELRHEEYEVSRQTHKTIEAKRTRLVIGTMTDPYQPAEKKYRITRAVLGHILKIPFNKVGLFTRSPMVVDDLDLIAKLPKARVHFSITPFEHDVLKLIEPIPVMTSRRFETIKKIKAAGIRVHVNVAPAIPIISDPLTVDFAQKLAEAEVDEFFIDPMQAYNQSFEATKAALSGIPEWAGIEEIMSDLNGLYQRWKDEYKDAWREAWRRHGTDKTLAIWCDHVHHVWRRLDNDEELNPRNYTDLDLL